MTVVIKESDTAAWKLFKVYYRVGIPEMFFHDANWVAQFGRPTSGNKHVDRAMMNTERTVMLPVCDIVRYFDLGASVQFKNKDDIIIIYRDIVEHLTDWENAVRNHIHGNLEIPKDDLVLFDQFKDAIYLLTIKAQDPLVNYAEATKVKRSITRRRGKFTGELGARTDIPDNYEMDGSHIFSPSLGGDVHEPIEFKDQKEEASFLEDVQRKTPPDKVKSFTSVFERYHAEQIMKGKI